MSNPCFTTIVFDGSVEDIADLHSKLIKFTNNTEDTWLGNIVKGFGYGDRIDKDIRCRGEIIDIDDVDDGATSFGIFVTSAWIPMLKMWEVILNNVYGNRIVMRWRAEELTEPIYATNNLEYFSDDAYRLTWEILSTDNPDDGDGYFKTAEEAVKYINELAKCEICTIGDLADPGGFLFDSEVLSIRCYPLQLASSEDFA